MINNGVLTINLDGGRMFAFGGHDGSNPTTTISKFDDISNAYTAMSTTMDTTCHTPNSSYVNNTFILNGRYSYNSTHNYVKAYDSWANTLSARMNLPSAAGCYQRPSIFTINNYSFLYCGFTAAGTITYKGIRFDHLTNFHIFVCNNIYKTADIAGYTISNYGFLAGAAVNNYNGNLHTR